MSLANRLLSISILSGARRWRERNSLIVVQALIISGILFLGPALAFIVPPLYLIPIGLLPFGIAVVLILMRWPALGFTPAF